MLEIKDLYSGKQFPMVLLSFYMPNKEGSCKEGPHSALWFEDDYITVNHLQFLAIDQYLKVVKNKLKTRKSPSIEQFKTQEQNQTHPKKVKGESNKSTVVTSSKEIAI